MCVVVRKYHEKKKIITLPNTCIHVSSATSVISLIYQQPGVIRVVNEGELVAYGSLWNGVCYLVAASPSHTPAQPHFYLLI